MIPTPNSTEMHVWISQNDPMPQTCCTCGMFTDHLVKIKHTVLVQQAGEQEAGCLSVIFQLVLHFALGPIGWLISILIHGRENKQGNKTIKKKIRLKLSQCQLCHGTRPPEIIDANLEQSALLFLVHPNFLTNLKSARLQAETSD